MSEKTVEIVYLPLKPGLDLLAGTTKEEWESILSTIAKQPGAKKLLWGRQIENPDTVQMAIEWESLDSHKSFMESPSYRPFLNELNEKFLAGDATPFHVMLPSSQVSQENNPFNAPVTECISAFFAPEYTEQNYTTQFSTFRDKAAQIPNVAAKGLAGGWSVEKHPHEKLGEGVEGKLFAAFIGWPSVEAHMDFRATEEFKDVISYIREGPVGLKVWHVAFVEYK